MGYEFELEGEVSTVWPVHGRADASLSIDGVRHDARLHPTGSEAHAETTAGAVLEIDGRRHAVFVARDADHLFVHLDGRVHRVRVVDALARARRAAAPETGEELLRAPMPGVVVAVDVAPGAAVGTGERLMTIESMKLQTLIRAPHAARVDAVLVAVGASFDQGDALVRLVALDAAATDDDAPAPAAAAPSPGRNLEDTPT